MSWIEHKEEIGDMLSKQDFAFQPNQPLIHIKKVGDKILVVDLEKEDVCYCAPTDMEERTYLDQDGMLSTIRRNIEDLVGVEGVKNTPETIDQLFDNVVDEEPTNEVPKTTGLVHIPPNVVSVVRPMVSAQEALAVWNEFQTLKKAILEPSDFQRIGQKDYMKKSAWRKFANCFNLNDKIIEETQIPHADGVGWTWKLKVLCTAPNGRTCEGVGVCSTSERNFSHLEHDTYATAHTRAKNRAISDMVAAGEVSAEEVST